MKAASMAVMKKTPAGGNGVELFLGASRDVVATFPTSSWASSTMTRHDGGGANVAAKTPDP